MMRYMLHAIALLLLPAWVEAGPPPQQIGLKGSQAIEVWLNNMADEKGLVRVKDDKELLKLQKSGYLMPIPPMVCMDKRLDPHWRFVMPQVAYFLGDFGLEFLERFGHCPTFTSAVRTEARQIELIKKEHNPNAAPVYGPRRSLHFTGAAIDLTKVGLVEKEVEFVRSRLIQLKNSASISVSEEQLQSVFHVVVFPEYQYSN